jgi:hypothetical protein
MPNKNTPPSYHHSSNNHSFNSQSDDSYEGIALSQKTSSPSLHSIHSPERTEKSNQSLPFLVLKQIYQDIEAKGGIELANYKRLARYNPQFYEQFDLVTTKQIYNRISYWKRHRSNYDHFGIVIGTDKTIPNLSSSPLRENISSPLIPPIEIVEMSDYASIGSICSEIQRKMLLPPGFDINRVGMHYECTIFFKS